MPLLPRSLALRVALLHAAAAVLICLPGTWLAYRFIDVTLAGQVERQLQVEADGLRRSAEKFQLDRAGLMAEIRGGGVGTASTHRLLQHEGATVDGELPPSSTQPIGPHLLRLELKGKAASSGAMHGVRSWLEAMVRTEGELDLLAHGVSLPGGYYAVLAADLTGQHVTALLLAVPPLLVGLLAGVTALVIGLVSARRLERRLRAVSAVAVQVMGGQLGRRLPARPQGDEIDRLMQTVNGVLARLEMQVADLTHVTRGVAHEMNTPLTRMRLLLDAALARSRDAGRDAAALDALSEEVDGAIRLFRILLGLAEPSVAGARRPERVLLSDLVEEAGEFQAAYHDDAGGALQVEVAPGLAVMGQEMLIKAALSNLIENAQRHAGSGAHIRLGVGLTEAGLVRLEVADDGPGIPTEEQQLVLQRFYRLSRSRDVPGSGLGLALVAAVAQAHGATLALADAAPGAARPGLCVKLDFPRVCGSFDAESEQAPKPPSV